jgi:hypothetical protein
VFRSAESRLLYGRVSMRDGPRRRRTPTVRGERDRVESLDRRRQVGILLGS